MELFINKYFQSSGLHTNRDIYCGAYVNFLVIFNFLLSISDEQLGSNEIQLLVLVKVCVEHGD